MLTFVPVSHQIHLGFVWLLQQFQDTGVTELFVYAAFGLILLGHPVCYGLFGSCHLIDHSQIGPLGFVKYTFVIIEINYPLVFVRLLLRQSWTLTTACMIYLKHTILILIPRLLFHLIVWHAMSLKRNAGLQLPWPQDTSILTGQLVYRFDRFSVENGVCHHLRDLLGEIGVIWPTIATTPV